MQDYSEASFDLPGGRSSSRSPNGSSTGDLLGGITATKDPYAADKYTKRTSSSSKRNSERKERRKSRRTSSNKYGGSSSKLNYTDSNNSNSNASMSSMSKYSDDPNNSSSDNNNATMMRSSVTSYADSKYVKQPPATPSTTTTNDEINALLQGGSHDPDDPLSSPGDHTTDAGIFRDEFEDELDEIEMEMREDKRHNLTRFTSGNGDRRTGFEKFAFYLRVYAIPLLIGLLFLVGIAAGILYLMGFGKSEGAGVQKYLQAVPIAPATLKLMCETTDLDGSSANTFQVPALCHDACAKAECCWNTADNSPYVCTTDTQNQCPPYKDECSQHKEFISTTLPPQANNNNNGGPPVTTNDDDEMMVPEFPSSLRSACQVTGLEASTECKAGCAAASCCWNDQTDVLCATDTITNCVDYKDVCDFLNDQGKPSDGSGSGMGSDIVKTWPFPDAPQGLSVYCDPGEMEEISLHICEDKCNEAECCWKDGAESCVSEYPAQACHDYTQACGILNNLNTAPGKSHDVTTETAPTTSSASDVPEAPDNLADTCSQDRIANSEKGGEALIACEQDCLRASCCWQPNVDSPCTDNAFCAAYQSPCSIFKTLFGKPDDYDPSSETLAPIISQVPQASFQIDLTCNPDVLKPSVDSGKFIVECEKECLKGACCWKKNHPTICPDASECAAYDTPCGDHLVEALLSLEAGRSTPAPVSAPVPAPTSPSPTAAPPTTMAPLVQNNVPEAAGDIGMICNADVLKLSVSDGQFIVQCEKECLEGACCWKENHSTICPDASQCASYEPCKDHLVPALEEIEGVNHGLNLASSSSSTSIPAVPSDMNLRCSFSNLNNNIDGRGFCEEICNQALCCWNGQEADSCKENSVCSGYANCENLLNTSPISGSGTGNAPPAPPSDLASTCAAGNIIDLQGLEQCRQECDTAECCWLEDTEFGSCFDNADCQTYRTDCLSMRKVLNLSGSNRRRMLRLG